ncbi:MAG: HU family DNA-binding protein [Pseudomonadota bacterium]
MAGPKTEASDEVSGTDAGPVQMKKPELLDAVVARTNLKKRDVKPAVEAALAVIGDALARGEQVNLPPMGKLRVIKSKELGEGAQIMTLKLRTAKNAARSADSAV